MDCYERIKELRVDRDLTQSNIATVLSISRQSYCDYENRITDIPLKSLITLAEYYDVDMNYICGLTNIKCKFPK